MKLHKEGYNSLRNQLLFIFFTIIILDIGCTLNIIIFIQIVLFILTLNFFRVPKRVFQIKEGKVYAPCDGKVVVIEETEETEYYKDKRIQVSIFMSPLNVHNNLYPTYGKISYKKYHPGKYLVAWSPKASTDNERCTVVIENDKISILCRQIAGALARRIVTYAKVNDSIKATNELGFIKFGSRVDLFLPIGTKIETKIDNKVTGGQTIIATY